jgi:uncharacterized protein
MRAILLLLSAATLSAQPASVEGLWQGTLDAGVLSLRLVFHVHRSPSGQLTSTMDSLDQGASGVLVQTTTFADGKLRFALSDIGATFEGALSADGKQLAGTFTQGAAMPLTLRRVAQIEQPKRPQMPKAPFPYDALEVSYSGKGGVKLAGTLTLPAKRPAPAVLLITGSGAQDRDETLFGHKPFLVLADFLTRRGIAVLRVDDRGVGGSAGKSSDLTLEDMADDVLAGVAFLKARRDIDAKHIGLVGHSEGGIVGPLAATKSSDVAFIVMLAGTGVNGEEIVKLQAESIIRSEGAPEYAIGENRVIQQLLVEAFRGASDEQTAIARARAAWQKRKLGSDGLLSGADKAVEAQITAFSATEMRSFLFHDPAPILRKVKVPVLALNGARDVQVSAEQNAPAISAALSHGGNPDFTVAILPGLNHLFQTCVKCNVSEYGQLEETFAPAALRKIGAWIATHTVSRMN